MVTPFPVISVFSEITGNSARQWMIPDPDQGLLLLKEVVKGRPWVFQRHKKKCQ
jgi:hypothetical protein